MKKKVEAGFDVLGIDKVDGQRQATMVVLQIQKEASSVLSEVKVQISEDFKSDKVLQNELLTTLGYNAYYKQALRKEQNALIQLLYQFKENPGLLFMDRNRSQRYSKRKLGYSNRLCRNIEKSESNAGNPQKHKQNTDRERHGNAERGVCCGN